MKIDSIMVGPIMTNCYLLSDETAGVCALIDPGDEAPRVLDMVARSGCQLQYILLTHGHFDHTTAVRPILEQYPDLPVYINEKDVVDGRVGDMELVFSRLPEHNQRYYHDGDTLPLGSLTVTVLETPGHSKGSVCLVVGDVIFSGDTLFRCSCGRTDFPGGSMEKMMASLRRLGQLEGDLRVLPGHMEASTLDRERRWNPYLLQAMQ